MKSKKNFTLLIICATIVFNTVNAFPLKHKNTFLEYKGTLLNDQKKPLAGAKIKSSAGERTVITDRSGTFSISAEPGDTLYVSLTGYKDLTAVLTDNTSLSLVMDADKPVVISDGSKNVEMRDFW